VIEAFFFNYIVFGFLLFAPCSPILLLLLAGISEKKTELSKEETVTVNNTETDQDVLYRKQREYMRTNHW